MSSTDSFPAFVVDESKQGAVTQLSLADLPPGEVVIRASYSSLNFKDALAATAHPGVARQLPHVPGIDVVGVVESSEDERFQPGDQVFVTGYEMGAPRWGGWSAFVRVPADWIVRLPRPDLAIYAIGLGTAGFTAAQSVASLQLHSIAPENGEVLVTGATGGVGSLALRLLSQLGYQVVAMTGKPEYEDQLLQWGATRVLPREALDVSSEKPLLKATWAAAVDTVGGPVLAAVIKQIEHRGCVATCGNVAGTELPLTVFPFILRGVKLDGIDSAMCPRTEREAIWDRLFGEWYSEQLIDGTRIVPLAQIDQEVRSMLRGESLGRVIVDVHSATS